jgi:hypothetical protein
MRARRLASIAGYAAPRELPRESQAERHIDVGRAGELVGIDCLHRRSANTRGVVEPLTAIDVYSSYI